MEVLESVEFWHWWVLAALLIVIEVIAPSTVLLWPGIAAAVVGFALLAFDDMTWHYQVLLFAVLSVSSIVAWRAYMRGKPIETDDPGLNRRAEQHVGRVLTLEEPIADGRGRLKVDGVIWKIEGVDLDAGKRVKIVGADGVILKVEAD